MTIGIEELVKSELSGSVAKSYIAGLTEFHRVQGSPMMRNAAECVRAELARFGVDAKIEEYPADGRRKYWTYTSVMGWEVRSAELRLVEPEERLLARFNDIPQSLHTYSRGTPAKGVAAELVDVGKGVSAKHYAEKQVKGKLVLATGKARAVHDEAVVKRGAAGVITDTLSYEFPGVRESLDVPDAHSYHGIWPNAKMARKVKFGFSLSKRQGEELRNLLRAGKTVRLHAKVDASLSPGKYSIVTSVIRGSTRPNEEIFLVAHLCHPKPSANDNASGCGLLMEVARTIHSLIESGKIKHPARSIRFLWVPETVGTVVYLSKHPSLHRRFVAGINMDMVGEDQVKCGSTLCMDCTPDSLPSYLNDFVYSTMERSKSAYDNMTKLDIPSNFRLARTPFTGGSDHAEFNDSSVGAPCVSLTQWPDRYYHTSMDTIDNVSEDSLRRVGWTVTLSALTLADADVGTAHELSSMTASEGMKRISEAVKNASGAIFSASSPPGSTVGFDELVRQGRRRIEHCTTREVLAVRSVQRLRVTSDSDAFAKAQADAVAAHGSKELLRFDGIVEAARGAGRRIPKKSRVLTKHERDARALVPRRLFKGTLDSEALSDMLGGRRHQWFSDMEVKDSFFSRKMYEMINLMNGERSAYDIAEFVSSEYGSIDLRDALRFFRELKAVGLIEC